MSDGDRILIPEVEPKPEMRLGRNVNHDPRSRAFAVELPRGLALVSVRHEHVGQVLFQGNTGSCTGNAVLQALMTRPLWRSGWAFTEDDALSVYSRATQVDPFVGSFPPDDTGSDGLSACKVAKERGLIDSYAHAFGLQASLESLVLQPDITGVPWLEAMYYPEADGRVRPTGAVVGGHEFARVGLDVENRRVWCLNSWGDWWGANGFFYLSFDDYGALLAQGGDVTVPRTGAAPPPPAPTGRVFVGRNSGIFHDQHRGVTPARWFDSATQALAAGFRPCRICRPTGGRRLDDR